MTSICLLLLLLLLCFLMHLYVFSPSYLANIFDLIPRLDLYLSRGFSLLLCFVARSKYNSFILQPQYICISSHMIAATHFAYGTLSWIKPEPLKRQMDVVITLNLGRYSRISTLRQCTWPPSTPDLKNHIAPAYRNISHLNYPSLITPHLHPY